MSAFRLTLMIAAVGALLAASPRAARAQGAPAPVADTTTVQELVLTDGSTLYVHVLSETPDTVAVRLVSGDVLRVARSRVRSLRRAPGTVRGGRFLRADPNPTRLLFAPTARPLPRGSGYLALYEVVLPFVTIAPTDHIVLSGGTPIVPGVIGKLWWVAPKVNVLHRGTSDVAIGMLALGGEDISAGVLYAMGTRGTPDHAITAGLGYGFSDGDLADEPAFLIGLEQRVSQSVKLVSEGYAFSGEGVVAGGVRFFGQRLSADLAIALPLSSTESWFPLVNFSYSW